jgi:hypothetical protein
VYWPNVLTDPRLTNCIQEAKDDYRSCLDDCARAAISLPGWRILVAVAPTMAARSLCLGSARY